MICHGLVSSSETLKHINLRKSDLNPQAAEQFGKLFACCPSLESIDLSENENMGCEFKMICDGLKFSCNTLKQIQLRKCDLYYEQANYLGNLISSCSLLNNIDLSENQNMGYEFKMMCDGLKSSSQTLKQIQLRKCDLNYEQAKYLGNMFRVCSSLENIDLSENQSMGYEFKMICDGLKSSSETLNQIQLRKCGLNYEQAKYLGNLLSFCSSLENIDLSENQNMGYEFKMICNGLKSSCNTLKQVQLRKCDFNFQAAECLAKTFRWCSKIEYIDLSQNQSMGYGLKKIFYRQNYSFMCLKAVDLRRCVLNKEQAKYLGETLKQCFLLEVVDLSENESMRSGFKMICEGLKSSLANLKQIMLISCCLNFKQVEHLGKFLSMCSSIEVINVSKNQTMGKRFEALCEGLKSSFRTLKQISFSSCDLSCRQTECLGKTLRKFLSLEVIDLSDNQSVGYKFESIFEGVKSSSTSLKCIDLRKCNLNYSQTISLKKTFKHYSTLKILDSPLNEGTEMFFKICFGLKSSLNTLKRIDLPSCNLNTHQADYIGEIFKLCFLLRVINLSSNVTMGRGFKNICHGLKTSSKNLREISLNNCDLTFNQAEWLGEIFRHCSSLELINLSRNPNMGNGVMMICDGLKNSLKTLKQIDLKQCDLNDNQILHSNYLFGTIVSFNISTIKNRAILDYDFINPSLQTLRGCSIYSSDSCPQSSLPFKKAFPTTIYRSKSVDIGVELGFYADELKSQKHMFDINFETSNTNKNQSRMTESLLKNCIKGSIHFEIPGIDISKFESSVTLKIENTKGGTSTSLFDNFICYKEIGKKLDKDENDDKCPKNFITFTEKNKNQVSLPFSFVSESFLEDPELLKQIDDSVLGRHKAIIIVITENREVGTRTDLLNLYAVFSSLNYEIEEWKDVNKKELLKKIRHLKVIEERNKDNLIKSLIVVILAHGINDHIILENDKISFEDVLCQFDADSFPILTDIPKIFIFQACRKKESSRAIVDQGNSRPLQTDASPTSVQNYLPLQEPKKVQFHEMYSTLKGEAAYRTKSGSIYIRGFILAMCYLQESRLRTIQQVTKYVNFWANQSTENMIPNQVPIRTETLSKDYFFFPQKNEGQKQS
ncbi:DgyrCDS14786 [Dimorphilus gyrociliatus]|uniref:DgyrCDS14786 n=1 Tax=Dimorphilus gyrociliatus TaxID=2664684 RepID=A0A7I8WF54_9ANNE|nr:DgyrCDS14786 [Dimorphilus gyrociliatus]